MAAVHDSASPTQELFVGHGIYDVLEIAHLIDRLPHEVVSWAKPTQTYSALLYPRRGALFSFHDLVTAHVVAKLRGRGVSVLRVRKARDWLAARYSTPWPLAHAAGLDVLATSGGSPYVLDEGDSVDASLWGQLAFPQVIEPLVERLTFGADRMAQLWRPADGIVVDPAVQAGSPCVEGTRIATHVLAELSAAGEDVEDLADDYDLDLELLQLVLRWEHERSITV